MSEIERKCVLCYKLRIEFNEGTDICTICKPIKTPNKIITHFANHKISSKQSCEKINLGGITLTHVGDGLYRLN